MLRSATKGDQSGKIGTIDALKYLFEPDLYNSNISLAALRITLLSEKKPATYHRLDRPEGAAGQLAMQGKRGREGKASPWALRVYLGVCIYTLSPGLVYGYLPTFHCNALYVTKTCPENGYPF